MDSTRNVGPVSLTRTLALEQIDDSGNAAPMLVDFGYDPADPYAVSLRFATAEPAVCWTFGRDLLLCGMYEPSGDGDVHVFPSVEPSGVAVVLLELIGPEADALVKVRTRDLEPFVDLMFATVPAGTEPEHLELDREIQSFLSREG